MIYGKRNHKFDTKPPSTHSPSSHRRHQTFSTNCIIRSKPFQRHGLRNPHCRIPSSSLLSYALFSLSVHFSNGTSKVMKLIEPSEVGKVVVPYHAYSPSGSALAKVVFVNHARDEDCHALEALGVNVTGCIVIVRRGEISRDGVVEKAAGYGDVAVLMYTEGDMISGVERGTVMSGLGDPLSPGWGGVEGGEKLGIPSLLLSVVSPFAFA